MARKIKDGMLTRCLVAVLLGVGLAGCDAGGISAGGAGGSGGGGSGGGGLAPTVTLTASPAQVQAGGTITLTWTSSDPAATCTASSSDASSAWKGTEPANGTTTVAAASTPGTYSYLLTCTDAAGSGVGTTSVSVGPVPPPTVALSFSPNPVAPSTATTPSKTTLTWSSTNATSCTASGGDGADGWSGAVPTSGTLSVNAPQTVGTYSYILTCTGPGGTNAGSTDLIVSNTPSPSITFSANPTAVPVGGSSTLTWSTVNATSCAASEGDGTDGWSGAAVSTAGSKTLTNLRPDGFYPYTLTCNGPGGSTASTVFITVGTPPVPTVTISVTPNNIRPGQSATLTWSSTNARSCTASGSWSGPQKRFGTASTGTLTVNGAYSYTLTCTGPSGSAAATTLLTVSGTAVNDDCGAGVPTTALLSPAYTATATATGLCTSLGSCSVSQPQNVTDPDLTNFATINVPLDLLSLGAESLKVAPTTAPGPVFPVGRKVGFVISNPSQPLTVDLLQGVSLSTLLGGAAQETATTTTTLRLDVLSLLGVGTGKVFVSLTTTKAFDAVVLTDSSTASVLGEVNVYAGCVSNQ